MSDAASEDQWTTGARLVEALGYTLVVGDEVPRPSRAAVVDLVGRRVFAGASDAVWRGIAGVVGRVSAPLSFAECCRVLLLEWAFDETDGRRKRRLVRGDPLVLTTLLVAFSHACLRRATPAERHALLAAISDAAAAEPD